MKRILFLAALLLAFCASAFSQNIPNGSRWYTGGEVFVPTDKGDYIEFMGGSLHEGGYGFILKKTESPDEFILGQIDESDDFDYAIVGRRGDRVRFVYDTKNAWRFLEVYQNNLVSEILFRDEVDELYYKVIMHMEVKLNGEYVSEKGESYVFDYGKCKLGSFVPQMSSFSFGEENDMPVNVLRINGEFFMYFLTLEGMKLYVADFDEQNDSYSKGKFLANLKWIDKGEGRWPWTSTMLISRSMVTQYSKKDLRLMRNEILARKGWVFQAKDLKDYFGSKSWYHPGDDNSKIELSLSESIVVDLIKSEEAVPDENRYVLKD